VDELEDLLRQAAAADRSTRVELFRDRIAVYGGLAVERVRPWLTDPSLDAFAVVIIEHAARHGALKEAKAALKAGLPRARQPIVSHIKAALERLGVAPSPRASRSSVGPGYVPRPEAALSELGELVAGWEAEGRPRQPGVPWPRDDWLQAFRAHEPMLTAMPDLLDRAAEAAIGLRAAADARSALAAFIATRAWGDSDNGYGAWRTAQILKFEGAGRALLAVARTLRGEGALAAYRRLADGGDCRLHHLGVAFGTKFLYFCQPDDRRPRALIHDRLMSRWLQEHAGLRLSSDAWRLTSYASYLEQMHAWAAELGCAPDQLEMLIFRSMAPPGSHWAW
jgi:hypothetical protein